jgi:chromosomal replication initiation ATPase DnaA
MLLYPDIKREPLCKSNDEILREALKKISAKYDFPIHMFKGARRFGELVKARAEFAKHIRSNHPDISLVEIGVALGGRDHTTIINLLKEYD